MRFPPWVNTPARQPKSMLAKKRLKYLLHRAALESVEGGSIAEFAKKHDLDRSSLHTFVQLGSFSAKTAVAIEAAVGREHTPYEFLLNPLDIKAE